MKHAKSNAWGPKSGDADHEAGEEHQQAGKTIGAEFGERVSAVAGFQPHHLPEQMKRRTSIAATLLAGLLLSSSAFAAKPAYDTLITGGTIYDGLGGDGRKLAPEAVAALRAALLEAAAEAGAKSRAA